jgi:phage/conjugal plasmid C-4 type zinc finger TraR family protein
MDLVQDAVLYAQELLQARPVAVPAGAAASRCRDCSGIIPEARRRAMPGAIRCLPCQEAAE